MIIGIILILLVIFRVMKLLVLASQPKCASTLFIYITWMSFLYVSRLSDELFLMSLVYFIFLCLFIDRIIETPFTWKVPAWPTILIALAFGLFAGGRTGDFAMSFTISFVFIALCYVSEVFRVPGYIFLSAITLGFAAGNIIGGGGLVDGGGDVTDVAGADTSLDTVTSTPITENPIPAQEVYNTETVGADIAFDIAANTDATTPAEAYNPNPDTVTVDPYERKDGTFVKGHIKTVPDGFKENNISYKG